ncbi:MAG TPA: NADH-quinone oxidoreductase subunit J [Chloroflexota bacterium]|nr:NADH-quinone oxidoreductase subunit J [Chloroflexota bacterium]
MPVLEVIVFWVAAIGAVIAGIGVIASTAPVYSAVSLIATLASLAVLYLILNAQFIAAAQVLIYAGAVMVLFLFVITLLGVRDYGLFPERQQFQRYGALVLGVLLLIGVIYFVSQSKTGLTGLHGHYNAQVAKQGNVQSFGLQLFNGFLLPFEVTPFLLVVAMIGAVALGKSTPARRPAVEAQDSLPAAVPPPPVQPEEALPR